MRALIPGTAALFFLLAIVLPLVRLYLRTGTVGLVRPEKRGSPESFVEHALVVAMGGVGVWVVAYGWAGPERLGVWRISPAVAALGWLFAAIGLIVIVVAQAQMGASWRIGIDERPTDLVRSGFYRWTRNPIYSGLLVLLLGLVILTPSAWSLAGFAAIYLIIGVQTRLEERHLLELHRQSFLDYASEVGRFLPGIGRLPKE